MASNKSGSYEKWLEYFYAISGFPKVVPCLFFPPCPCEATESVNTSEAYNHRNLTFRKCVMPFEDAVLTV